LRSWWAVGEKEAASSEERVLRRLPFFLPGSSISPSSADGPVIAHSERVTLSSLNLNVISTRLPSSPPLPPLMHRHPPYCCTATAVACAFSSATFPPWLDGLVCGEHPCTPSIGSVWVDPRECYSASVRSAMTFPGACAKPSRSSSSLSRNGVSVRARKDDAHRKLARRVLDYRLCAAIPGTRA